MFWLSIIIGTSFLLFVVQATLCQIEAKRGHRLYGVAARSWFDARCEHWYEQVAKKLLYISRYMITLSWYYSLHAFLVVVLRFIAGVYSAIESIVLRNRDRAKKIRSEHRRSHLTDIADHRQATALSSREKATRKKNALEGK